MLDPQSAVNLINDFLRTISVDILTTSNLSDYLISILFVFILLQFCISKVNLILLRKLRNSVMTELFERLSSLSITRRNNVLYDYYLHGYEAIIKSFEIVLFYIFLLIYIFTMSIVMGWTVIVLVPILVGLLVFRNRKEAFVQDNIRESREESSKNSDNQLKPMRHYDKQLNFRVNNIISSDILGGITIGVIFMIYVEYKSQFSSYGVLVLLLIFSIRFAVLYAGELSRQLNVVLRLRAVLKYID